MRQREQESDQRGGQQHRAGQIHPPDGLGAGLAKRGEDPDHGQRAADHADPEQHVVVGVLGQERGQRQTRAYHPVARGEWLPNQVEWMLLAWFAAASLGVRVVCVNSRTRLVRFPGAGPVVPVSDVEVTVTNVEGGAARRDRGGEIRVRGDVVMPGYYGEADATARAVDAQGWVRAGHLGLLDDRGDLSRDRTYHRHVHRRCLSRLPGRDPGGAGPAPRGVAQAYVVCVPDARWEEVGFGFVQRRPGVDLDAEAVRGHAGSCLAGCKGRRDGASVDEWPLLATGKFGRFRFSASAAERVGAQSLAS